FAEALMMFGSRRFASRFSARYLILAAALTMAARLAIMAFNPPVALLFLLQTLHAITFALGYLGTVNFIANWTSEDIAAEAQSFYVVVVQVVSAAALIGFGYLTAVAGAGAFLGGAALALAGAVCVIISLRLKSARREAGETPARLSAS
ncbi:MAG: MFS transporter, partial [Cucumibacter sp.]